MSLRVLVVSADPARAAPVRSEVARVGGEVGHIHPDELEGRAKDLRPPHVVVLDARDSHVDAAELCGVIRASRRLRSAAVLAVVSEHQLAGLEARDEVDDFVAAPYREAELRVRLRRMLAHVNEGPSATAVRMGELMLDPASYDVTVGGARIDLTLKEYELLKHLVTNPGRVFTRDQLLDSVWGYDYVGGTRTVDVHIRRLRAKLGEVGETAIETIRGVGYSFRPPREERGS
jgi:DNA-binding response OmpR family regulator